MKKGQNLERWRSWCSKAMAGGSTVGTVRGFDVVLGEIATVHP